MAQHMENIINGLNTKIDTMNYTITEQSNKMKEMTDNLKNLYDITMATVTELYIQKHDSNVLGEVGKYNFLYTDHKTTNTSYPYKGTAWWWLYNNKGTELYTKTVTIRGTGNININFKYINNFLKRRPEGSAFSPTLDGFNYVALYSHDMMYTAEIYVNDELKITCNIGNKSVYTGGSLNTNGIVIDNTGDSGLYDKEKWLEQKRLLLVDEISSVYDLSVATGDQITIKVYVADVDLKATGSRVPFASRTNSDYSYAYFDTTLKCEVLGEAMTGLVG